MNLKDKTILIVGASSGIGKTLALRLSQFNNQLIIVARRSHELNEVQSAVLANGSQCISITSDALDTDAASSAVNKCIERFKSIDIAVLNVGAGPQMDLKTISSKTVLDNMELNYNSMVNYLFPVLKHMREKNEGMIVHMNSLAGLRAIPMQGPYSAAKGAARILMETCRMEYRDTEIKFLTIYPGYVRTERVMKYEHNKPFSLSEYQAVDHIIKAIQKEKNEYAFPFVMRWAIRLLNVLPKKVSTYILMKREN